MNRRIVIFYSQLTNPNISNNFWTSKVVVANSDEEADGILEAIEKHQSTTKLDGIIKPNGGDINWAGFYCGNEYPKEIQDIMVKDIQDFMIKYAKLAFPRLSWMSDEEIRRNHMYWGTDSTSYKGFYNGDTWIVYDNIDLLPEGMKIDAEYARGVRKVLI